MKITEHDYIRQGKASPIILNSSIRSGALEGCKPIRQSVNDDFTMKARRANSTRTYVLLL